jgi:hypothetical protein
MAGGKRKKRASPSREEMEKDKSKKARELLERTLLSLFIRQGEQFTLMRWNNLGERRWGECA